MSYKFHPSESRFYKHHPVARYADPNDRAGGIVLANKPGTIVEIAGRRHVWTHRGCLVRISAKRGQDIHVPKKDKKTGKFVRDEKGRVDADLVFRAAVDVPRNSFFAEHFYPEFTEKVGTN